MFRDDNHLIKLNILFDALRGNVSLVKQEECLNLRAEIKGELDAKRELSAGELPPVNLLIQKYENALLDAENEAFASERRVISAILNGQEAKQDFFNLLKNKNTRGGFAILAAGALADIMGLEHRKKRDVLKDEKHSLPPSVALADKGDMMLLALLQNTHLSPNLMRNYPGEHKSALNAALYYYQSWKIHCHDHYTEIKQPFQQTISKIFNAYLSRDPLSANDELYLSNALLQASAGDDQDLFRTLLLSLMVKFRLGNGWTDADKMVELLLRSVQNQMDHDVTDEIFLELKRDLKRQLVRSHDTFNPSEIRKLVAVIASTQELIHAVKSPEKFLHFETIYQKGISRCDELSRAVDREKYKRNIIKITLFLLVGAAIAAALIYLPPLLFGAVWFAITLEGLPTPIMAGSMVGGFFAKSCDGYLASNRKLASPMHKAFTGFFEKCNAARTPIFGDGGESKRGFGERVAGGMAGILPDGSTAAPAKFGPMPARQPVV